MNPVRTALFGALTADAPLTGLLSVSDAVFYERVDQTARTPYVVFHKQAGTPTWTFGGRGHQLENDLWTVKAIDRGDSPIKAEQIAAEIDRVLETAALDIDGRETLYLHRESDLAYPEEDGAETYRHVGGIYRLLTEPA